MPLDRHCVTLRDRLQLLLDQLPPLAAILRLRRDLVHRANVYASRQDVVQLQKLVRETQALARSLGIESGGRINHGLAARQITAEPEVQVIHHAAGPGLPGWGRSRDRSRRAWTSRREFAPVRYPRGEAPTGPDTRMPASDIVPSKPESSLSPSCRERLRVYRQQWHCVGDVQLEAQYRAACTARSGPDDVLRFGGAWEPE